jgi:hypothetical protein
MVVAVLLVMSSVVAADESIDLTLAPSGSGVTLAPEAHVAAAVTAAVADVRLGNAARTIEPTLAPRIADADWSVLAALHRHEQDDPDEPPRRDDGGFGRWLRRHWWVPVLAAGAVALAVQDDSPDSGEDDD